MNAGTRIPVPPAPACTIGAVPASDDANTVTVYVCDAAVGVNLNIPVKPGIATLAPEEGVCACAIRPICVAPSNRERTIALPSWSPHANWDEKNVASTGDPSNEWAAHAITVVPVASVDDATVTDAVIWSYPISKPGLELPPLPPAGNPIA